MSILIGSNTVINDSRELENISDTTGSYSNFQPKITQILASQFNAPSPIMTLTMVANRTYEVVNAATGMSSLILLDRTTSNYTPFFSSTGSNGVHWGNNVEPTWSDHRYWLISIFCWSSTRFAANASGHTI
jgi:hypothetical protein